MNTTHSYDATEGKVEGFIPNAVVFVVSIVGIVFFCGCVCQMRSTKSYHSLESQELVLAALRAGPSMDEISFEDSQRSQLSSDEVEGRMEELSPA